VDQLDGDELVLRAHVHVTAPRLHTQPPGIRAQLGRAAVERSRRHQHGYPGEGEHDA
jgi:hypothetical protein